MLQGIMLAVIGGLVGLDQLTKWLTVQNITLGTEKIVILPGFLDLCYIQNEGMGWGLLSGYRWVFVAATVAVMAVFLWALFFSSYRQSKLFRVAAVLVIAGGIGNMIDRVVNGYVVDMIHVHADPIGFDFPVFNVADCCVVIGAILLLVYFFFFYDEKASKTSAEETNGNHSSNS